jgi:hypothetical protein
MSDVRAAPAKRSRKAPRRARKPVEGVRTKVIPPIRCTEAEQTAIKERAEQAGLSVGAFLRALALGDPGPRAVRRPPVERKELARLLGEIGKIGSNVNQLARGFNASRLMPGFPELLAIRQEIGEMRAALIKALGRDHQG